MKVEEIMDGERERNRGKERVEGNGGGGGGLIRGVQLERELIVAT